MKTMQIIRKYENQMKRNENHKQNHMKNMKIIRKF